MMRAKGKKLSRSNRKVEELFSASVRLLVAPIDSFSRLVPTGWQVEELGDDFDVFSLLHVATA